MEEEIYEGLQETEEGLIPEDAKRWDTGQPDMENDSEPKQDGQADAWGGLAAIEEEILIQGANMVRMSGEIHEMHKLYHNEFAGRLKTMQEELELYHEIDRGRVFDDILREIARIYCDNEALLKVDGDEKIKKHIRYLFMDLEQLLESNGVMMQRSRPGDKRNNKFCQIVNRVDTDDIQKHDTVVCSKGTGFYTEKRPLIKELIDVYVYQPMGSTKEDNCDNLSTSGLNTNNINTSDSNTNNTVEEGR